MKYTDIRLSAAEERNAAIWGPKHYDYYKKAAQATEYLRLFLKSELKSSSYRNCYGSGTTIFTRLDGGEITGDDLEAIGAVPRGQVNSVKKVDSTHAEVYWVCDSSG